MLKGLSLLGAECGVDSLTARNQLGGFPGRMPPTGLSLIKNKFMLVIVGGHASSHRESLPSRDSTEGADSEVSLRFEGLRSSLPSTRGEGGVLAPNLCSHLLRARRLG